MVERLKEYVLEQIQDLPEHQQQEILLELSGDFAIMAEFYE